MINQPYIATINHIKGKKMIKDLIETLKSKNIKCRQLEVEGDFVAVHRKTATDTGITLADSEGFDLSIYLLLVDKSWSVVFQTTARLISEVDPLYSKENTMKLLGAVKDQYAKEVTHLDTGKHIPIEWDIEYGEDSVTEDGQFYATVDGCALLGELPTESLVTLIDVLINFPTVELVDVTDNPELAAECGVTIS